MTEFSKDKLLRSWKEIAAYLGCDVRTCHRWEVQRGMPVHRAEGAGAKSPVFAYRDELDQWFQGTFTNSSHGHEKTPGRRGWVKWAAAGVAILVLAAALIFIPARRGGGQAADFTIDGSELVILAKDGRELGRFDTRLEGLMPASYYKERFQSLRDQPYDRFPCIDIRDVDGDGEAEVLFTPRTREEQTGAGWMVCLNGKGEVRWRFKAGRELTCGGRTYSPDYRISGFHCHDMDGDGRFETLVFAYQRPDWPCQMAVLDAGGNVIGEFWNAGYLRYPLFHDINGDGREELVVVGVNNEYRGGCLAVFDTRRISGASPQSGKFACREFEPGSELYYVTVPYTDVSEAMGNIVEGLHIVTVTENDRLSATYGPSLFYEFGFGLECLQVYWGHGYEFFHDEGVAAGKITSVLGDGYARMLREGVRYWNGSGMVPEVSMVRR